MKKNIIEVTIGILVIAVTISFLIFVMKLSGKNISNTSNYNISANFDNANGINIGSAVKLSGIKVGTVKSIKLDVNDYTALVELSINPQYKIPSDSTLAITSASLLGGKFLAIIPGLDPSYIEKNGKFLYTKSAVNLESLLMKFSKGKK